MQDLSGQLQFTGVGSSDRGNLDLAFAANVVSLKAFYMTIRYNPWPGHGSKPDYTLEAALDMVDGLLPNLTSLDLHARICFHSEPSPAWDDRGWLGFQGSRAEQPSRLSSLSVEFGHDMTGEYVERLFKHIDVSALEFLQLRGPFDSALTTLAEMHFSCLKTLQILPTGEVGIEDEFLSTLSPLQRLLVSGTRSVDAIVQCHAVTLRYLELHWHFNISVEQMRDLTECHNLEELHIATKP